MIRLTNNEKSFMGGLIAALSTLAIQLQQSGQFTSKEALLSLAAWAVTHFGVYLTTNTPQDVPTASTSVTEPLNGVTQIASTPPEVIPTVVTPTNPGV